MISKSWFTSLIPENDQKTWPTRMTHEFNLQIRTTDLPHDFDQ